MWTPEMRQRYSWTRRKEGLRLTDQEWAVIAPLLPQHDKMGCPWKHGLRTIVDAIVHLLRTGCAWGALPDWAPPRSTVYEWFRRLADGGWLDTIHHALLMAVRELQGREASPTLGIIDSQTVKVMAPAGPRGYDNAKKINGRKRHILADNLGHLLAVLVTDGAVQDRDGGIDLDPGALPLDRPHRRRQRLYRAVRSRDGAPEHRSRDRPPPAVRQGFRPAAQEMAC
jgi:putative transposase